MGVADECAHVGASVCVCVSGSEEGASGGAGGMQLSSVQEGGEK